MHTLLTALLLTFSSASFADEGWTHFGNPFTLTDSPISAVDFLQDP